MFYYCNHEGESQMALMTTNKNMTIGKNDWSISFAWSYNHLDGIYVYKPSHDGCRHICHVLVE